MTSFTSIYRGKPRRMFPVSLGAILGTLGPKLIVIEDEAATSRTLQLRQPVDRANQRFDNKCNSKQTPKIAAPAKEPAAMHSHLRVIQGKRRGSKYG